MQLEIRLDELEKKFVDEKKNKEKKIKELEILLKSKSSSEKIEEKEQKAFKCKECDFETVSQRGLLIQSKENIQISEMRNIQVSVTFVKKH